MDEILPRRSFVYGATILDKIDGKLKHPLPHLPNERMEPEKGAFWPSRGFIIDLGRWNYILYDEI